MQKAILKDSWQMKNIHSGKVYSTTAPCSVISVLLEAGEIPHPYDRDNADKLLYLFEDEYEFTKIFSVNGDQMREDHIDLVFYGIDTLADIYLNGQMIGSVSDMHRTYRFSVKPHLHMGANEIGIHFYSPLKYIQSYETIPEKRMSYTNNGSIFGNQWIRKSHSMFGWDWGPKLPDIGIFRDVVLECYSKAKIQEVFFHQEHGQNLVTLYVDPILYLIDRTPVDVEVLVGNLEREVCVIRMPEENDMITKPGENVLKIQISNPLLWWPNGMGNPNLYDVTIRVRKAETIYDELHYQIGLRTITVSRETDEYGQEFALCVNGVKMFAMGANYIPEDAIYPQISEEKQKKLVISAAMANFNCLRVWGGGYYPSDEFYQLCDRYGILVWQDLMFACNVYELTPEFEENIVAEIKDNVSRLRHHACLALWCGNNEIESAWLNWSDFAKESNYLKADYIKIFEYIVPKALREADEETFFWPSSPSSGGCFDAPSDENRGDSHYWEVWHGQKPWEEYRNHYFRFLSEFGFQSFPCLKTVASFTKPQERNLFHPVMEAHQKNDSANGKIMAYLADQFLFPADFESTLYLSQILQGLAIKTAVEHMRRNRGRCMGTLYWQMNDNWPVASWSSVDYYGRWKALHYMAKNFYAPAAGSVLLTEHGASAHVVNDSNAMVECKIRMQLMTMDGQQLMTFTDQSWLSPGKVYHTRDFDMKRMLLKHGKENVYVETCFTFGNARIQSDYQVFLPYREMHLLQPQITLDVVQEEECFAITLSSQVFTPFVLLDFDHKDVLFEDNVFHLGVGHPVTVRVGKEDYLQAPLLDVAEEIRANKEKESVMPEEEIEYLDDPDPVKENEADGLGANECPEDGESSEIEDSVTEISNHLVIHYLQETIANY